MAQILTSLLKYLLYVLFGATILIVGLIAYLMWFQQPFFFPKLTGKYAVGTMTYHWIDTKRQETQSNDPAHPNRELMAQVWFPAAGTLADKPTASYAPLHIIYFLRKYPKLAQRLSGLSCPIYSYAQPEAALASDELRYPVIIFSHGNGGIRNCNTAHFEELASHGYIVVAISHTYYSALVEFPDGRAINVSRFDEQTEEERNNGVLNFVEKEIEIWTSDVQFVLDQLEQLNDNKESIFYERLDQANIGMFGHSFGGATAIQVCRRDLRVKAGVCLDGALFGADATKAFNKPFIFMLGEHGIHQRTWTKKELKNYGLSSKEKEMVFNATLSLQSFKGLAQAMGKDAYTIIIKKVGHMSFCDMILLQHALPFFGLFKKLFPGPINGFRATEIVNAYLVNFFNKYLKGQPSELLDGQSMTYPEVEARATNK